MKHNILVLMMIVAPLISWGQFSLQTCQEKAKANYPLIKQYDLIDQSAEYTLSNASKGCLPQFSVTAIAAYIIKGLPSMGPASEESEDKSQFIGIGQINQTIWDGGATHAQKEIIKADREVEKSNIDIAFHELAERVNQLFFSILLLDEQLNQSALLTDNLNRNLKAVRLSNENGVAYSSDVDEVKVELLKVEQRTIEIVHSRQGYANMLALMVGEPVNSNLQLEKPVMDDVPGEVTINRPELSLYQHQRNLVDAQQAMNKVGYMPKVGLLGAGLIIQPGVPFGAEKMQSLAIAGLSLSWNTKSLYQSSNNNQLARIQLDRINNQQETFLFNTNLQLSQQTSDIQKQRSILTKDNDIVALKTTIKKAYELKYQNGMCTMNDLLQATNGEIEARSNQALHEVQLLMTLNEYKTTSGN
ncbi:MAG TPA: TolC family protein [Cyclobacteriaceae bacterium]|nr:TolC family protein [Cyclobacteriaceae bacterium]